VATLRLVLDTNVLISAALSGQGAPAQLLRTVLAEHQLVFSDAMFLELRTRIHRPKFDRYISLENRQRMLHDLDACAHWVDLGLGANTPPSNCRDPDDDFFIATALQAQAPLLVIGDQDLLDVPPVDGLLILAPAQALAWLQKQGA
jgi:putative PIN family toxin of toxin-antitoxin system